MINRKHESIDLLKLYFESNPKEWNAYLSRCLKNQDTKELEKTYYGLAAGMTDLANQNLNTANMVNTFLRMQKSIENTLKQIWRKENPNPLYDPLYKGDKARHYNEKKYLDDRFEQFLKRIQF